MKKFFSKSSKDEENLGYSVKFKQELSNGALIFTVINYDEEDEGAYVIASPAGLATFFDDGLYDPFTEEECQALKNLAEYFFSATRKNI